jgi:hypothetical protein
MREVMLGKKPTKAAANMVQRGLQAGERNMGKLLLCATVLTGMAAAGTLVLLAGAAAAGGAAVVCCCRSSQRTPSSGSAAAAG